MGSIDIFLVEHLYVVGCACHVGIWTFVSANFHVSSFYALDLD
jgi:hypothetical protein